MGPTASTGWDHLPDTPPLAPPPDGSGAARALPAHPPIPGVRPPGPPSTGGPPPDPNPFSDPRNIAILSAAVLVALALVVAALVYRGGGTEQAGTTSSTSSTAKPSTTSTTRPSSSTTAGPSTTTGPATTSTTRPSGPPIDPAQLQQEVAALSRYVEQQRGLTFKSPVQASVLDDQAFADRLSQELTPEQLQQQAAMLQMLGLVPPGTDPADAIRQALIEGVLGWYDAAGKELVVRGGTMDDDVRQVLVHELTHALDDQNLNLNRPEYDERKDEIAFGFRALVEGDAVRIERAWHDANNPTGRPPSDQATPPANGADPEDVVKAQLGSPYVLGSRMVNDLLARGGQAKLDGTFAAPPDTSEQVLHLDKLAAGEKRKEVPPPPTDGKKVTKDGVLGEVLTQSLLASKVPVADAEKAAAGWGGDWYVTWTDDQGRSCVRVDWQMDTTTDLDELRSTFDAFTKAGGPGQVEAPDPATIRWTNCVAVSGGGKSPL